MQQRIEKALTQYPWLVIEEGGRILGYTYATGHRDRMAYQWSADVSVYVHQQARRRGIARRLYTALLRILRQSGYFNAYAGIALPNQGSVSLHEAMGFTQVAVYEQVGYKHGVWRDVGWWHLSLGEHLTSPDVPRRFSELREEIKIED